jgi:hypothetical protein
VKTLMLIPVLALSLTACWDPPKQVSSIAKIDHRSAYCGGPLHTRLMIQTSYNSQAPNYRYVCVSTDVFKKKGYRLGSTYP